MISLYTLIRRLITTLLGLPPSQAACRFTPTCSYYCHEALHKHGPFRGGFLCVWRLLRCQPFVAGGYDPVP